MIYEFLFKIAGFKNMNSENLPHGIVEGSGLDNHKCESFNVKAPNSCSILAKIYNSLFSPYNKQVCIIKPFPIVKEAYVKTSGLNLEASNSNSSLTEYLSDNLGDNYPKQLTPNVNNESDSEGSLSSSSSSSYNTVVIDLKVLKGIDGNNKKYLMLKDLNDFSSENLISILNKPEHIKVSYDKLHMQDKNCTNHKYLSFDYQNFYSEGSEKKMHKRYPYMQGPDINSLREITFSINNDAVNRINNNSLIIESENCNRLPVKELSSFASSSQNFPSEK